VLCHFSARVAKPYDDGETTGCGQLAASTDDSKVPEDSQVATQTGGRICRHWLVD
jgi:hypothetical protein